MQRKMQKYLLSFVLTGNPNTKWASDKVYWPKYGSNATELVFNSTMYLQEDDLANVKSTYFNKALWY
jgi:carboxylesterase type B